MERFDIIISFITMYDVIVVGVGSMGSSACYHLAKRGVKVLGLEQYSISHEYGSHTGQSRLIRKAYFEHSNYVPLLHRAYRGWSIIEQEANQKLYWETGIVYFGLPDCEMLNGIRKSANLYNIDIDELSHDQIQKRWPQFNLPKDYVGILEPEAGFLTPEMAIQSLTKLSIEHGAEIHENEKVISWGIMSEFVLVTTSKKSYQAKKIIFTTGAFTEKLIKTKAPLRVTQQFMGWTSPLYSLAFQLGELPCWMISEEGADGPYYGFPVMSNTDKFGGMKIAYHREGELLVDGLAIDSLESNEQIILDSMLERYFPNIGSPVTTIKKCKYSYSPDNDFIIDQLSEYENRVIVAAGFSGHGFKFVPVVGEALADFVQNQSTELPIDFLSLSRF